MTVHFIGLNSRHYPYTRVRCYAFARVLEEQGISVRVYAMSEDYLNNPADRFTEARDRVKLKVQFKLFRDLAAGLKRGDVLYLQKVHHHIAVPFLLGKIKHIPIIVDYDDWDFDRSPFFNHTLLNRFFFSTPNPEKITCRVMRQAFSCVASSRYLEKTLGQFNNNIHYLPTGVDLQVFDINKYSRTTEYPVFFWNGDVWGDVILENLIFIFSCLSELMNHQQSWELQLVVFGKKVDQLKRILRESYPHLPVRIIENAPATEMPQYYARASIGLMPLLSDAGNMDWTRSKSPTKLFEYMAMKLIPVCQNRGEPPHIIEHGINGFLFNTREECVGILNDLLDNYKTLDTIAENACRTVREKYSLEVLGIKLKDIIEETTA